MSRFGGSAAKPQLGHYLKQINGPALGVYQIEPATHEDLWLNYLDYREELATTVRNLASQQNVGIPVDNELITNLAYATAIARLIYYRVPEAMPSDPNDIEALARYYKQYYNTPEGKATEQEFMDNYQHHIG